MGGENIYLFLMSPFHIVVLVHHRFLQQGHIEENTGEDKQGCHCVGSPEGGRKGDNCLAQKKGNRKTIGNRLFYF